MIWIVASVLCVGLLFLLFSLLHKSNQNQLGSGFKLLQDSVEGLQRNILLSQKEFEKNYDVKSTSQRTEIQDAIQNSRKEMQAGLANTTLILEQKVAHIDQRLDQQLTSLSECRNQIRTKP